LHLTINPAASKPIYVQIMDEVRRLVVLGQLRPEDPLPSVRQLAAELRINHNTIVQAYRELEREGLVYVRRGQGTFVAAQTALGSQRETLLGEVADRALTDAQRHGIAPDELIEAIRRAVAAYDMPKAAGEKS
jgi:GntR family transcriptional regulator